MRKAPGKKDLKPTWCARHLTRPRFSGRIERHHHHYTRDLHGNEQTSYLCPRCHIAITDINCFIGHVFKDMFGEYPTEDERPEVRSYIFHHFLKTSPKRNSFKTTEQIRFWLRRKLALYRRIKVAA